MSWFKKKGPEIIDYSMLQKRGLIEEQKPESPELVDLRPKTSLTKANNSTSNSSFDFLSSLAGAGSSAESNSTPMADSLRDARRKLGFNAEVNQLKVQMDNLDFKMNNLMDKINEINQRLREKGI